MHFGLLSHQNLVAFENMTILGETLRPHGLPSHSFLRLNGLCET